MVHKPVICLKKIMVKYAQRWEGEKECEI